MTSPADAADLKENIFGRTIFSPGFVVIATIFSELKGGDQKKTKKKPGLNRIKEV